MRDQSERELVLMLYPEHGTADTARQTGVPPRTVRRWVNEANLTAARSLALTEGGELLAKTHAVMREEVKVLLLEKVVDLLERMDQEHVEYKAAGAEMHRLVHPVATSGDVKNYATSVQALIDKYRLEMGESTARTETLDASKIDLELARTVEEWRIQTNADRHDADRQ